MQQISKRTACKAPDWQLSFVSQVCRSIFLVPHSLVGTSLHLRGCILAITLARRHRERSVAGTFTSIYDCEEPLPIQGSCATHRARAAGARRAETDRNVTSSAGSFVRGARSIGTCPGKY